MEPTKEHLFKMAMDRMNMSEKRKAAIKRAESEMIGRKVSDINKAIIIREGSRGAAKVTELSAKNMMIICDHLDATYLQSQFFAEKTEQPEVAMRMMTCFINTLFITFEKEVADAILQATQEVINYRLEQPAVFEQKHDMHVLNEIREAE